MSIDLAQCKRTAAYLQASAIQGDKTAIAGLRQIINDLCDEIEERRNGKPQDISEGKVKKGGVNEKPPAGTAPREPPKGQGEPCRRN